MSHRSIRSPLLASLALAALGLLAAAGATLSLGSKAPALEVSDWIKGAPVTGFEPGTVYVVEFWATWCGPCIKSIPKLSALQREHKDDLVVIGVAAFERKGPGDDMRKERLESFVKQRTDSMTYRIAYDPSGQSARQWMTAAGKSGIPCAFVVDHKGTITYIGNPSGMESAVDSALRRAKDAAKEAPKGADGGATGGSAPKSPSGGSGGSGGTSKPPAGG